MNKLKKIEMGKLVGGANEVGPTRGGTRPGSGGSPSFNYSQDCTTLGEDGNLGTEFFGYSTDSTRGWTNPCN